MRWATGYKTQLAMVKGGYSRPSRRKVMESGEMEKSLPPEFVKAVIASMAVADPVYKPLILGGRNTITAPVMVTSFVTFEGPNWGKLAAAGLLVVAPVLVFTFVAQKGIIRGLTGGALK